jgi:hypothetical protein
MEQKGDNIFQRLMGNIFPKPEQINAEVIKRDPSKMGEMDKELFKNLGVVYGELSKIISENVQVNFERHSLYAEVTRSLTHPIVGAAMELYTDSAAGFSKVNNATVWVTSDNKKYENTLNRLLDFIGIEEKISDWTYNTGSLGDLFVKLNGVPGKGVLGIEDHFHPIDVSRVDYNGRLIGFYNTPLGSQQSGENGKLIAPWEFVHFRLLGAKVRRPFTSDITSAGYRTVSLLSVDTRRASSSYGNSLLTNALPIFKRLRLAEDTMMMARLSKSVLRYIYKVKVDGTNIDAVGGFIERYTQVLKRLRAMNLTPGQETFRDTLSDLSFLEDVILPVWGNVGDLQIEKLGGEADIKWIVDIEELRNQLAVALRVPLQLMGGYSNELNGFSGGSSIERQDIRFAKNCYRLQRSIIEGIYRICQVHLAYLGMNPDPRLFEVHMPETSSAEEEEVKSALEKGVDIAQKLADMITQYSPDVDRNELFNYLNSKILKLSDLDIDKLTRPLKEGTLPDLKRLQNTDIKSFIPTKKSQALWESAYGSAKVKPTGSSGIIEVKF